jgi:hypothetical protein
MQSMPITTNVESSNPMYSIQNYVIKFVSDLLQGFSEYPGFQLKSVFFIFCLIFLISVYYALKDYVFRREYV